MQHEAVKLSAVMQPKRHHVVPQFLLRRFALNDKVELVDRDDMSKRFQTNVNNALVQTHFYSVDTKDGRDTAVETLFAHHVERPAARAIRRLVDEKKSWSLPGLRRVLATFLAFQYVRGPAARHASVGLFKAMAQQTALTMTPDIARAQLCKIRGSEPTDEEVAAMIAFAQDTTQYRIEVSSEANVHLMQVLELALELIPFFALRRWRLLEFDEPVLIAGDEPVALIGSSLKPGEPLGLENAREVVFPTDPQHAFVMVRADIPCTEERYKGTAQMADIINRHIAFGCHRFIVQYPGTDPLKGIALPAKAEPVRIQGDYVIFQPRLAVDGNSPAQRSTKERGDRARSAHVASGKTRPRRR